MNNSVTRALNNPQDQLHGAAPRVQAQNSFFLNESGGAGVPLMRRQSTRRNNSKDSQTFPHDKTFQAMFGQRQNPTSSDNIKPPVQQHVKLDIPKDAMTGDTPTPDSIVNATHKLPNNGVVDRGLGSLISRPDTYKAVQKTKGKAPSSTGRSSISKSTQRISEKRIAKRTQKELDKIDRLALPPTKPPKLNLNNDASFDSDDSVNKKAKRGRKTMAADKYVQESEDKINGWKQILKDGKFKDGKICTEEDIAKLKNQISA